ncbi:MAG: phage minor head protein [Bacteroidales bacterium]|jgi:uncharacterized protein with gpF-like domain|nr:phage minor head protein [Bacteroidales bacterium]
MAKKTRITRGIRPNIGIEAAYSKKLTSMASEMERSVFYFMKAAYKKQDPAMTDLLAKDSALSNISLAYAKLGRQWRKRFNDEAEDIAKKYVSKAGLYTELSFMNALKDIGFTVQFKPTAAVRQIMAASVKENISLIKSIPQKHLEKVEGIAMRSISKGGDLEDFVNSLKEIEGVTTRRAHNIANDQMRKISSTIRNARAAETGIEEAIWQHSNAGAHPRESHVQANGKKYKIAEGCFIDGEYIQPGEKINCRCFPKYVLPF